MNHILHYIVNFILNQNLPSQSHLHDSPGPINLSDRFL